MAAGLDVSVGGLGTGLSLPIRLICVCNTDGERAGRAFVISGSRWSLFAFVDEEFNNVAVLIFAAARSNAIGLDGDSTKFDSVVLGFDKSRPFFLAATEIATPRIRDPKITPEPMASRHHPVPARPADGLDLSFTLPCFWLVDT